MQAAEAGPNAKKDHLPSQLNHAAEHISETEARSERPRPLHLLVVLGSGGHTTEMLRLLSSRCGLYEDRSDKAPTLVTFVYARTDERTLLWKQRFEEELPRTWKVVDWKAIPRAREVGQSWATSLFTTAHSLLVAAGLFLGKDGAYPDHRMCTPLPNIVICNGPGTCIPPCLIALLVRLWRGMFWTGADRRFPRIIFIETVARVHRLSLTGKILYRFADRFLVQWPELTERHQYAEFYGRLV